jgi:hypothetical protein
MAWTAPMTAVAGAVFTAAQYNTFVRDNLNECAPAKASATGSYFTTSDNNQVSERMAAQAVVIQQDSFNSTSYINPNSSPTGNAPVVGPAVTVETGSVAFVAVGGRIGGNATGADSVKMSWGCSGASSISATDTWAAGLVKLGQYSFAYCNRGYLATGLNPGLNTFTAKYAVSAGTGFAAYRTILVMPF